MTSIVDVDKEGAGHSGVPASWFETGRTFDQAALIDELIAGAALRYGDRPALIDVAGSALSHAAVDELANRVATSLFDRGIGPGEFVGIYCDHTPKAVAAIVGVLRAGAAYVPLDPRWPATRIQHLAAQMGMRTVFADAAGAPALYDGWVGLPALAEIVVLDAFIHPWEHHFDASAVTDLWDTVAADEDPIRAAGFNFLDPSEVSTEDGRRYAAYVAEVVRSHRSGARVLDIGCGSGLIAAELLDDCDRYVGIDPAGVAVTGLAARYAADPRAAFHEGFAHEVAHLTGETFDVALFASTVQFFPDASYLLEALDAAAARVRPGGIIVLADLVDPSCEEHEGLRLEPAFFTDLVGRHPAFAGATCLPRAAGTFDGRLGRRYDVILTTAQVRVEAPAPQRVTVFGDFLADTTTAPSVADRSSDDVAYVIFTSGSTGNPKGVVVRHRSVINLIEWLAREYAIGPDDRLLFTTSFAFDLSVYDMFGLLAAGGSIQVVPDDVRASPDRLAELLESGEITFWDSAPAALSAVLPFLPAASGEAIGRSALRLVFLSGDWVPLSTYELLRERFPQALLVALGGATECTVWSNHFRVDHIDPRWRSVPYGKPMQNARYYVLDEDARHAAVGVAGELYIAGECVAAGYYGDPELSARKFLDDPFHGGAMYRTGDLARWRDDGNIEFLGRRDNQVKIRGYRVELGEIQAAASHVPGVREALALTTEGADGRSLAIFYVAGDDGPDASVVRDALSDVLPAYLVPDRIERISSMPVGPTGKVDHEALQHRVLTTAAPLATAVRRSTDELALLIAECWQTILGDAPAHDDVQFIRAGGSSLSAARLAALLRGRTGTRMTVRTVLQAQTPAGLTATVRQLREAAA